MTRFAATCDLKTLKLLAEKNWRGITTSNLVCEKQDLQHRLNWLERGIDYDSTRYFLLYSIESIRREILRRRKLQYDLHSSVDNEIVNTIKERTPVEDVIGWYTEVYTHIGKWGFRCPLHSDEHPSGIIYRENNSWYCFQCKKGGDVFDAVMLFGKLDFPKAISILAKNLGLDTKPLIKGKKDEPF